MSEDSNVSKLKVKWKDLSAFAKFMELFKWAGAIAVAATAVYSSCEAELAKRKAAQAPEERVTKTALDELSKKLNDLARDVEDRDKKLGKALEKALAGFDKRASAAEAQADSVRSLFIGHALGSRGVSAPRSIKQDLEKLTKSISDASAKSKTDGKPSPQIRDILRTHKSDAKRFKPARSYNTIKQQQQKLAPPTQKK